MRFKNNKIVIALVLTLVSLVLLISASFAWLTMATAPEVSGLTTNIGSNGSLEIALLSAATYMDPSLIQTSNGSNVVNEDVQFSNRFWGNVVDLSDRDYGLDRITMLPSQLDISSRGESGHFVASNLLMVPNFNTDGRLRDYNDDMVSGELSGGKFTYSSDYQHYGVRGIGTISNVSPRQVALINARAMVATSISAAVSSMESVWRANGDELFDIIYLQYVENDLSRFGDDELAVLRDTAVRMLGILDYVDTALRQGVIGYAAANIEDEQSFARIQRMVENKAVALGSVLNSLPFELPGSISNAIAMLETDQRAMVDLKNACDRLEGSETSYREIENLITMLIHPDTAFLADMSLSNSEGYTLHGENKLSLYAVKDPVGTMQSITKYVGDYQVIFNYDATHAVSVEATGPNEPWLVGVTKLLAEPRNEALLAGEWEVALDQTYGYAIDMAFRCNADSQLLLQTAATQRVDHEDGNSQTQGSGSYMRFSSEQLTTEQVALLMDALRVGFLDNQNRLIGLAKLNTSNHTVSGSNVTARLYMYDFSVSESGSISVGKRLDADSPITSLTANTPKVLTIVVWLDGEHVSNSLASYSARSIRGVLNLQFSSDADLIGSDQSFKES